MSAIRCQGNLKIQSFLDMFPRTDKTQKWQSIYYREQTRGNDVLFISSCHVETIALLQKSNRKSKPDTYVKLSLDMEDYYRIMDAEKVGK